MSRDTSQTLQKERSHRGPLDKVRGQSANSTPLILLLPCAMARWCMGVQAGTAGALVLQKSGGRSHLVSYNQTDAREHSVRKGHSV